MQALPRFTQLEQRVNRAVLQHCANAVATLGGVEVRGVLDLGNSLDNLGYEAGTPPTFALASSAVPAKPEGLMLQITAGNDLGTYRVGAARHDGTGMCVLDLLR